MIYTKFTKQNLRIIEEAVMHSTSKTDCACSHQYADSPLRTH